MSQPAMGEDSLEAATAAFRVGYESASPFGQEYRRLFGAPPLRDIMGLRLAMARDGVRKENAGVE